MDVAFSGESRSGRRQLHFVGTPRDNALSQPDAAPDPNEVSLTCADFNKPPGETLAPELNEDVRPTGFHQQ